MPPELSLWGAFLLALELGLFEVPVLGLDFVFDLLLGLSPDVLASLSFLAPVFDPLASASALAAARASFFLCGFLGLLSKFMPFFGPSSAGPGVRRSSGLSLCLDVFL